MAQASVTLRSGMSIGNSSAEADDDFLFDCFVRSDPVERCLSINSPSMIVFGSTGAGKTAILRYIGLTHQANTQIDPLDLALTYVANSDVLAYLQSADADVDLFFQILWKHVLCLEIIRLRYNGKGEKPLASFVQTVMDMFSKDPKRRKAIDYLSKWDRKFWVTIDEGIREVIEKYNEDITSGLKAKFPFFSGKADLQSEHAEEIRTEIKHRLTNLINTNQLSSLGGLIDLLADMSDDNKSKEYYILIDKLDEKWIDEDVKFRLIRALIETLKPFRRIRDFKILVALRADILERTLLETKDHTFQREKFEDYAVRLKWTKAQLREIVDKRVNFLFKRRYTTDDVEFSDLFESKVRGKDTFDYMCDRTLLRPRDIIAFVNACFETVDGSYRINEAAVLKAESIYSSKRKKALEDEWQSVFPNLSHLFQFLASTCEEQDKAKRKAVIDFSSFSSRESIDDLALQISCAQGKAFDALRELAARHIDNPESFAFARELIATFYRVGVVGVKPRPGDNYLYSTIDAPVIEHSDILLESKIRVHPMLHSALGIREQ